MIILLSPSKSMDMEPCELAEASQPAFLDRSGKLVSKLRGLSTAAMMEFMDISENLAILNRKRMKAWRPPFTNENAKQALLAFTGDVYDGLEASTLSKRDVQYAQKHLRILSGLYGLLRPLDLIQPYRLEMGRPLKSGRSDNLYDFWRTSITEAVKAECGDMVVNLASLEYFKAIDKRALDKKVISPAFKDEKNGTYKVISFFAKKARGAMARFLITNRVTTADGIHGFAEDGYAFNAELSTDSAPVFTRPEA